VYAAPTQTDAGSAVEASPTRPARLTPMPRHTRHKSPITKAMGFKLQTFVARSPCDWRASGKQSPPPPTVCDLIDASKVRLFESDRNYKPLPALESQVGRGKLQLRLDLDGRAMRFEAVSPALSPRSAIRFLAPSSDRYGFGPSSGRWPRSLWGARQPANQPNRALEPAADTVSLTRPSANGSANAKPIGPGCRTSAQKATRCRCRKLRQQRASTGNWRRTLERTLRDGPTGSSGLRRLPHTVIALLAL
jgi:hypothetical protein